QALRISGVDQPLAMAVAAEAKALWEHNLRASFEGSFAERAVAAEELGRSGQTEAVDRLIELTIDKQGSLAAAAAPGPHPGGGSRPRGGRGQPRRRRPDRAAAGEQPRAAPGRLRGAGQIAGARSGAPAGARGQREERRQRRRYRGAAFDAPEHGNESGAVRAGVGSGAGSSGGRGTRDAKPRRVSDAADPREAPAEATRESEAHLGRTSKPERRPHRGGGAGPDGEKGALGGGAAAARFAPGNSLPGDGRVGGNRRSVGAPRA